MAFETPVLSSRMIAREEAAALYTWHKEQSKQAFDSGDKEREAWHDQRAKNFEYSQVKYSN